MSKAPATASSSSSASAAQAANPSQGGSYTRHPVTGELTATEQTAPAQPTLRAEAQDPDEAVAAAPAPAQAPANTTPQEA